ncbi:MAG: TPM domain-containing protein, partial [Pseudomonadota bacterium]
MFRFLPCLVLTLWLPVAAVAQTFPDYVSPYINDFASLLTEEQTRKTLEDRLILLRQDKGIEMTVVTLPG